MSLAKAEHVKAYTAAGLTLFSCKPDKSPKRTGWQHTDYKPDLAPKNITDTYAWLIPPGYAVIDYDKRRDTGNQLKEFFESCGVALPLDTFIVKSGRTSSESYHVYLKVPEDARIANYKVPGFPALDVKTAGGFVIAAGSKHPEGGIYTPVRGSISSIMDCPETVLHRLPVPADIKTKAGQLDFEVDDPQTRKRFENFLMASDPSGTYAKACYGRQLGLPEDAILEILLGEAYNDRRSEPKTEAEIREKIVHAFEYAQEAQGSAAPDNAFDDALGDNLAANANSHIHWTFTIDKAGNRKLDATLNNVIGYLSWVPTPDNDNPLYKLFRLNMFSNQIEFTRLAPWHNPDYPEQFLTDTDVIKVKEYLTEKHLYVGTELVREGILSVAHTNQYHPVRDWLLSLVWDGVARLDTLLPVYAGSPDTPYTREVGKNTILASVARILTPGCKHDHMLILEGEQGTGKTMFVQTLGGQWYADVQIDPGNKDTVQNMMGRWILEASEMEFLKKTDVAALKRFLTLTTDVVRLSYARYTSTILRQSVFIGTINPGRGGYLIDTTGNRRFWPVATGKIDIEALKADRDQIYAEAVVRFNNKEAWHITDPQINAIAQGERATREAIDFWEEIIGMWFNRPAEMIPNPLTTDQIAYGALNLSPSKLGRTEGLRIAAIMDKMGYRSVVKRFNGKSVRQWVPADQVDDDFIDTL